MCDQAGEPCDDNWSTLPELGAGENASLYSVINNEATTVLLGILRKEFSPRF